MSKTLKRVGVLGIPLLLTFLILGFHLSYNFRQTVIQPSAGWSRPLLMGTTEYAGSTVPAAMSGGGATAFSTSETSIDFALINDDGTVKESGKLGLPAATRTNLAAVGSDQVDLFWLEAIEGAGQGVYHATVDRSGKLTQAPAPVIAGVDGFVTSPVPGGKPALVTYGKQGVQAFREEAGAWRQVGSPLSLNGTVGSLSAQVLNDGSLVGAVHTTTDDKQRHIIAFRGNLREGLARGIAVADIKEGIVQPVSVGVDQTTAYLFYAVNTVERGIRVTRAFMATAPVMGETFQVQDLGVGGLLGDRVFAQELLNPTVQPGQSQTLRVAFLSPTVKRAEQNLGVVLTTFRDGKKLSSELVYYGQGAIRPGLAVSGDRAYLSFATFAGSGSFRLHLISTVPTFIAERQAVRASDFLQALLDTMFDMFSLIFPLIQGGMWLLPMIALVGVVHLFALTWAERNTRKAFWMGVILAVPLQFYTAENFLTRPPYTTSMPAWLAAGVMPGVVYVSIALLMLLFVLIRYAKKGWGALGLLTMWGLSSLIFNAVLFGPFARRG